MDRALRSQRDCSFVSFFLSTDREFFYFYIFFVDLSKIYVGIIFFQKCHHAAGSIGGQELPPFDPAVPSMGRAPREDTAGSNGGTSLPPIDPAVSTTAAL